MQIHRCSPVIASLAVVLLAALPADAQRARPGVADSKNLPTVDDLEVGTFVQVEGRFVRDTILADQIEVYAVKQFEETLDAVVEAVDAAAMTLTILGRTVAVAEGSKIQDADKLPLEFADIEVGQRVKAKGTRDEDGVLHARKLKVRDVLPEEEDAVKIEALIEQADLEKNRIVVLEMKVQISPKTAYKVGT